MNPQTICIPHSELPTPHSEPPLRRNGKIARLPKPTRDLINHMLDDNLPYHVILDELGEAGEGLSPQNLSNWVQGGYQDYLRQQERLDQARAQIEAAIDLLRQCPEADPALLKRACNVVAATLIFDTLLHHGSEALKKMVQANPAKILSLLNTECSLANASLKVDQSNLAAKLLKTLGVSLPLSQPASSPIKADQTIAPANPVGTSSTSSPTSPAPAPSNPIKLNQASATSESPLSQLSTLNPPPSALRSFSEGGSTLNPCSTYRSRLHPAANPRATRFKPNQTRSNLRQFG